MGLVSWMYLYLRVAVHSWTRIHYRSFQTPWLAVQSRTRVSSYLGLVSMMYLHHGIDVLSGTRTHYYSLQTPWLAVESRMHVSSYLGLVSWMYLHLRVDVHSETRTQYGNSELIRTVYTYANNRLINFSPKHQWEDSSKQYQVKLFIIICNN
ncbi:unnamed protein product [Schistosoma mattheei]|uniref:Uncharacterized protein n=1 Tax=Schistosoma mattheei TaxID=31246 RepID=A0A183NS33_9TREM|nr:unnamed protein product [Schistosoma mattheei]